MPNKNQELKIMFRAEKKNSEKARHKLYVYDSIRAVGPFNWKEWKYEESETSAKHFRDLLDEIPDGEEIELHVNSAGGEVGEGVTIYNLLRQKSEAGSRIVGYVDGMAYSVAMDIAMAADELHMGLGTSMFLHNPWCACIGNAEQLRNQANQLDALAKASRELYASRATISEDEIKEMMDSETMLAPSDCLKYGFCDVVDNYKAEGKDEEEGEDSEDDAEDPGEDDDKDKQIRQLKEALFRKEQIENMVPPKSRNHVRKTLLQAMTQLSNN